MEQQRVAFARDGGIAHEKIILGSPGALTMRPTGLCTDLCQTAILGAKKIAYMH